MDFLKAKSAPSREDRLKAAVAFGGVVVVLAPGGVPHVRPMFG